MQKITTFILSVIASLSAVAQTGSFMYDGVLRDYIVHVPAVYNASVPVPLVINLHGYTSNASEQQLYTQFDAIADTANFIVVYPNGVSNTWNSGWNVPYNSGTDDVGFLSALIDTMISKYYINLSRIHATGMSNGGFMSFRLACELENRIASIASVTGLMTTPQTQHCTPSRKVPVMFIHGTADATVPYAGSTYMISADSTQNYWRAKNGCTASPVQYNFPDINTSDQSTAVRYLSNVCADSSEVEFIKIINGGHTWPGVYSLPNLVTNQDIKASVEIWKFFCRHPMPSAPMSVKETNKTKPAIYPNPADDELLINLSKSFDYTLINILGETISIKESNQNQAVIATRNLADGIYFLTVKSEGKNYVEKVVVRH